MFILYKQYYLIFIYALVFVNLSIPGTFTPGGNEFNKNIINIGIDT